MEMVGDERVLNKKSGLPPKPEPSARNAMENVTGRQYHSYPLGKAGYIPHSPAAGQAGIH